MVYNLDIFQDLHKGDTVKYEFRQNYLVNFLRFRCTTARVGFFLEYQADNHHKGYVQIADMSCTPIIEQNNGFHHKRKISLERLINIQKLSTK